MHAIQTSGNCICNTTNDHFAGLAPDEIVNPLVWCELIRQWSMLHPEFAFLPRKFKIAASGARTDRAAIAVHDIGLQAVEQNGRVGFDSFVPKAGHVPACVLAALAGFSTSYQRSCRRRAPETRACARRFPRSLALGASGPARR